VGILEWIKNFDYTKQELGHIVSRQINLVGRTQAKSAKFINN
jgi:hypothetical protein